MKTTLRLALLLFGMTGFAQSGEILGEILNNPKQAKQNLLGKLLTIFPR